ncbi:MAG: hypothetical protein P8I55_16100 [Crocinitomix sp.]|nr:hypothetical protein [Crocinitomix sp.]
MKKLIFGIFALGLVFTSCEKEGSSDVNQNKVYCEYELFYNQNEDKTHAVARCRFGGPTGTLLELSDTSGASVSFNGDNLPYNVWYGGHHKEYAGQVDVGTFVYTNTNGVVYSNEVPTGEAIAFDPGFDTITKSVAENLIWDGTALSTDQHVGVFVGSWTWGEDASFWTADLGATEIVMGVSQKADLALGSSTVYMDRSTAMDIAEGTPEGGRIRYTI